MTRPRKVDWRNRWKINWITQAKDQCPCGSCWIFSAVGVIESMVRIERGLWCLRSEGDFRRGSGTSCSTGGWENTVLDWIREHGIADPNCFPWVTDDRLYTPCRDRVGRTVYSEMGSVTLDRNDIEGQKDWLDTVGPITGFVAIYTDFSRGYRGTFRVYKRDTDVNRNAYEGDHSVLIVGYDDVEQCWIIKNSWGQDWGTDGFGRIGYGEASIDAYNKFGTYNLQLDPWLKRRIHNGNFLENEYGRMHRNFEVIATEGNRIKHWIMRINHGLRWTEFATFGNDASACPTMIHSTPFRNLEIVYPTSSHRLHHWYVNTSTQKTGQWTDGGIFGPTNLGGIPGFIQSNHRSPGSFEVVVRTSDGRLSHWQRTNVPLSAWNDAGFFANDVAYSGGSLIQSTSGNLELVCVLRNGEMQYWMNDGEDPPWVPHASFGRDIQSPPFMIEGQLGATNEYSQGNYELCVAKNEQVQHWWRDNQTSTDDESNWHQGESFGHHVRAVTGLLQSSFGFALQVIVLRTDNKLQIYWRDGTGWHEGTEVQSV